MKVDRQSSCGSKPKMLKDLGLMFPTEKSKSRRRFGLFECEECKAEYKSIIHQVIKRNQTKCKKCSHKKYVVYNEKIRSVYDNMMARCYKEHHKAYKDYGARGISVCDEWVDSYIGFQTWCIENGYAEGLSIDRIDNNGNYEPSNCRFATKTIQQRNTRVIQRNNTAGHRGVSNRNGRYSASIIVDYKKIHLGTFDTALEAAKAYDKYVVSNNLEHNTNFKKGLK